MRKNCEALDVYINLHKRGQWTVLATCDADLIGKTLQEGKIIFHVNEKFYKGAKISVEEAVDLIKQSTVVNMVGNCIVAKAIEAGLVHPDAVLSICGVNHAQIVKL